jgi:heat shock protein HtpX
VDLFDRQTRNRRYTALLIGCFIAFFTLFGLGFDVGLDGYLTGGASFPIITVAAAAISVGITALSYYKGDAMVLGSLMAQPLRADDPEHRQLSNVVNEIALAAGLPRPRVFVIPDPSPNALAIGRDPEHASIAVTDGALALLDREETQGVVAHELSHIRNRDTLVMMVVAVLFGGVVMLADWGRRNLYYARQRRSAPPLLPLILVGLVVLSPLLSRLLAMAVSRQREYLADATAVELTRNPQGLMRALEKIERTSSPLRGATRGSAHLFIVNPLRRRVDSKRGAWADFLASHPPIEQRIAVLRSLAGGAEA